MLHHYTFSRQRRAQFAEEAYAFVLSRCIAVQIWCFKELFVPGIVVWSFKCTQFVIHCVLYEKNQGVFVKHYAPVGNKVHNFWPDCKAIPAYGLMMSVCLSVCLSVCPSVRPSTFWLTSVFKLVLGHINQYRLNTLHGNRPWWDLLNCTLSLWPWPWLFLFKVLNNFG